MFLSSAYGHSEWPSVSVFWFPDELVREDERAPVLIRRHRRPNVPMVPIGGDPTLFVGPMIWTDDVTVRQHWKVGDSDIEAADINVGDGTFVPAEPDSVRGWSGECPIRVWGGFVRDEVRGPLALIDETVVSHCW